ncbi:MAG: DNA alkylation repair protein [Chitinophagaceae bacterium]|nr:DNA alkylation repair protein [Chitinophagaceae bacterium]
MTLEETLAKLKKLGSEKMRIQNKKAGADDNQFGVKMGDIRVIAKEIKTDNALAGSLWKTGNFDAMMLSLLIMTPKSVSADELEQMVKSVKSTHLADWLNNYIVKEHPDKESLRKKWMTSKERWTARAGWSLTSGRIAREPDGLDLEALLERIESEMPKAPPEVQWTMNSALAQIGIHFPALRKRAISIGEKLGVYRDYPVSKGCTSPFAPIWINEMVKRQGK